MSIEQQLRDKLQDCAEAMENPSDMQKRIQEASYERYRNEKNNETSKSNLNIRMVACVLAVVLLAPIVIYTGPTVAAQIRTLLNLSGTEDARNFVTKDADSDYVITNLYADEISGNKTAQEVLARIYRGFPETKNFDIANAQITKGIRAREKIHIFNIMLMEKGKTFEEPHQEIVVNADVDTGQLHFVQTIGLEPFAPHVATLQKSEAIAIANAFLKQLDVPIDGYEPEVSGAHTGEVKGMAQSIVIYKRVEDGKEMFQVNLQDEGTSVAFSSSEKP
ncbi:hypothetical protein [Paenibacillus alvei]|uniref:hypothetical protein n=1 Tax=Paenibacillus alvei TaxID=44250 RepID=UPI0018CE1870|nr:hypothetical protein [Paenibacillus alvei]MBG9737188.1 hypothetical protein [Paenibacillus alvei]MBG9746282.1 hypothetical protein [Paenibacillus alvei]MCY9581627.1 hypothetical protein [Paenibacillus alvei]MCY9586245.1 hypothetical protein [Paenibacillus alvei]